MLKLSIDYSRTPDGNYMLVDFGAGDVTDICDVSYLENHALTGLEYTMIIYPGERIAIGSGNYGYSESMRIGNQYTEEGWNRCIDRLKAAVADIRANEVHTIVF
jgi:hypothetical protein